MSCFDKEHYAVVKEYAKNEGIKFVSVNLIDSLKDYNGYTIAYYPAKPDMRMITLAISYCSPDDIFKRKHGKYQAMLRLLSGRTVDLPLGDLDSDDLEEYLSNMFYV